MTALTLTAQSPATLTAAGVAATTIVVSTSATTSEIQTILTGAAGKTVVFPAATYTVTGLTVSASCELWFAPGATLYLAAGSNATVLSITGSDVTVRGGTVNGNRANQTGTGHGISVSGDRVLLDDVTVTGAYTYGVYVANADNVRVRGCRVTDTGSIGVFAEVTSAAAANLLIEGNTVDRSAIGTGVTEGGIKVHGVAGSYAVTDVRITGNYVAMPASPSSAAAICIEVWGNVSRAAISGNTTSGGSMGVSCDSTTDSAVTGNTVYNAKTVGIELAASSRCTVSGNNVDGNSLTASGIACTNTTPTRNAITGNSVRNCPTRGIYLLDADYSVVTGNTVTQAAAYAVECSSSDHIVVSGNMLYGSSSATKGVMLDTCRRLTVNGNSMFDFTQNGVLIYAASAFTADRIAIVGNTFTSCTAPVATQLSGGAALGDFVQVRANPGLSDSYTIDILDYKNDVRQVVGTGTPEGAVAAAPGSLFHREDGGTDTTIYAKESGTGNTGWAAI